MTDVEKSSIHLYVCFGRHQHPEGNMITPIINPHYVYQLASNGVSLSDWFIQAAELKTAACCSWMLKNRISKN